jgi:2-polyprenyl-3-methyl-5-hydroxy-6-metoxy-1,4-benzoquinol methylase
MDKFTLSHMLKKSNAICRAAFIRQKCFGKRVLDLGCICHSVEYALKDQEWLHKNIKSVASELIGVDYLPTEVDRLNTMGYNIVFADVTKPLDIEGKFDVIVAADIIEHLLNFEGFFSNIQRLLKDDGIIIITTPNPFYAELFHFVTFKQNFLNNPEHTCWIDPYTLSQLVERFGYTIKEMHYIKDSYKIKNLIIETSYHRYEILTARWSNDFLMMKIIRKTIGIVFQSFYIPFKLATGSYSKLVRHSDYLAVLSRHK